MVFSLIYSRYSFRRILIVANGKTPVIFRLTKITFVHDFLSFYVSNFVQKNHQGKLHVFF